MYTQAEIKELEASAKRHIKRGFEKYPHVHVTYENLTQDLSAAFMSRWMHVANMKDHDDTTTFFSVAHTSMHYDETFLPNGKPWWRDINRPVSLYTYQNEDFKLQFFEVNKTRICLNHIEVYKAGTGLGSKMLDQILDIADEFSVEIELVPVCINSDDLSYKQLKQGSNRLRQFYMDFGFKPTFNSALLVYRPI